MEMENVRLETTELIKKIQDDQDAFVTLNTDKMGKFETKMN
jgi:hypothetical protein